MRKNVKKNTGEKRTEKDRETTENWRPKGVKAASDPGPWSPPTMEIRVTGFSPKGPFSTLFVFRVVWPLWFFKNLIFRAWNPSIFVNITYPPSESLDRHQTLPNCQPADQESTLFVWSIEKSTGQMLLAHWYQSMSEFASPSDVKQHVDPSTIITRRIPNDAVRPATFRAPWRPLNAVKWPVLWQVNAVINSLFWTALS